MRDALAEPEVDVWNDPLIDVTGKLLVDVLDENRSPETFDALQRSCEGLEGLEVGRVEFPGIEDLKAAEMSFEFGQGRHDRFKNRDLGFIPRFLQGRSFKVHFGEIGEPLIADRRNQPGVVHAPGIPFEAGVGDQNLHPVYGFCDFFSRYFHAPWIVPR